MKKETIIKVVGSEYSCGPCPGLPLQCTCGIMITEDNVISKECNDECEVCDYCGSDKCPNCGDHVHCGGCV
ncbi:hypothetical protein LCGC14_0425480 [marine sediment metagenome]|uniref:Uncharacterized protein n=1 Tax=marine sediment metagenome TaxID=412755 RepID=A0A0F9VBM4_9ZZZZ